MRIEGIIWLEAIVEKLASKHRVDVEEVEQALSSRSTRFRFVERGAHEGDDVYMALGRASSGRYLTVLFVYKQSREALIISARDMADKERRMYGGK
jgi:uncharacterized DUF497 family protein